MITEKELWEVVLSRPDLFRDGLCNWVSNIYYGCIINREELIVLDDVLKANLPPRKYYGNRGFGPCYSFPYGEI